VKREKHCLDAEDVLVKIQEKFNKTTLKFERTGTGTEEARRHRPCRSKLNFSSFRRVKRSELRISHKSLTNVSFSLILSASVLMSAAR
jgi:hypothetical protein